jgi:hypothetical protein
MCRTPEDVAAYFASIDVLSPDEICHRSTWCAAREHPDTTPCLEKPRRGMGASDFGPRRAVKVGWR